MDEYFDFLEFSDFQFNKKDIDNFLSKNDIKVAYGNNVLKYIFRKYGEITNSIVLEYSFPISENEKMEIEQVVYSGVSNIIILFTDVENKKYNFSFLDELSNYANIILIVEDYNKFMKNYYGIKYDKKEFKYTKKRLFNMLKSFSLKLGLEIDFSNLGIIADKSKGDVRYAFSELIKSVSIDRYDVKMKFEREGIFQVLNNIYSSVSLKEYIKQNDISDDEVELLTKKFLEKASLDMYMNTDIRYITMEWLMEGYYSYMKGIEFKSINKISDLVSLYYSCERLNKWIIKKYAIMSILMYSKSYKIYDIKYSRVSFPMYLKMLSSNKSIKEAIKLFTKYSFIRFGINNFDDISLILKHKGKYEYSDFIEIIDDFYSFLISNDYEHDKAVDIIKKLLEYLGFSSSIVSMFKPKKIKVKKKTIKKNVDDDWIF